MINIKQLNKRSLQTYKDFAKMGVTINTPDGQLTYIDNGANILGVAHLDSLQPKGKCWRYDKANGKVYNPVVDDRLGVHILLDVLPRYGIKFDVLLTDGEEQGRSTAQYFESGARPYNWMFQFDRMGTDVVMYEYYTRKLARKIEGQFKVKVDYGLFSDICFLNQLGVKGFNWGCGYYDNHGPTAYFKPKQTNQMIKKFVQFYREYSGEYLEHKEEDDYLPLPLYKPTKQYTHDYAQWDMQQCPTCQALLGYADTVCPFCNTNLEHDNTCISCGKLLDSTSYPYCPTCWLERFDEKC